MEIILTKGDMRNKSIKVTKDKDEYCIEIRERVKAITFPFLELRFTRNQFVDLFEQQRTILEEWEVKNIWKKKRKKKREIS